MDTPARTRLIIAAGKGRKMNLNQKHHRPAPSLRRPTMSTRWASDRGYAGACLSVAVMAAGLWIAGSGVYRACATHEAAALSVGGATAPGLPPAGGGARVALQDGLTAEGAVLVADDAALDLNAKEEAGPQRVRAGELAEFGPADERRTEFGEAAMRVVTLALLVTVYVSIVVFQFLS
jgi:hypothetical protein